MRIYRFALIAIAAITGSMATVRPVSAASPWQLCLRDTASGGLDEYYLNFAVQGNAILVSGTKGR
jgi:hypothetical protein